MHGYQPGSASMQSSYDDNYWNFVNECSSGQNKRERVMLKPGQVERLLHEMELRPDLVAGRVEGHPGRKNFQRQWIEIAAIVSALPGPKFTAVEIRKRWGQLKYRMKTKTADIQAHRDERREGNDDSRGPEPLSPLEERVLQISQGSYAKRGKRSNNLHGGSIQVDEDRTTMSNHTTNSDVPQQFVEVSMKREEDGEESMHSSISSVDVFENGECRAKKNRLDSDQNGYVGFQDFVELQQGIFSRIEALESTVKEASNTIAAAIRESADKQSEHLIEQNRLLNRLVVGLCPQLREDAQCQSEKSKNS